MTKHTCTSINEDPKFSCYVSGPGASLSIKNLRGELLSSKMAFIELPMKKDNVVTTSANISFFSYKIGILAPHTSWMAERLK